MRTHSDALLQVLTGSFNRRLLVDVFHGSDRIHEGLVATGWQFDGDLGAEVKHSGGCTIVKESMAGESLVPQGAEGDLSPFRARLYLTLEVSAGSFVERVGLGWVRIEKVPRAEEYFIDVQGTRMVHSSSVELDYASLELQVKRRGFRFPEQAPQLGSAYAELLRITGMPVVQNVSDQPIKVAVAYEAREGGRLAATQALFGILGGVGVIDPTGAWTCVPDNWGPTVATLDVGPNGTVLDVPYSIDTDGVANVVVGSFEDPVTRRPITSTAIDTSSRLSIDGPYGEYTAYITDPQVTTQEEADARTARELANLTRSQTYRVQIQCVTNPLVELGDVVEIAGWTRPLVGRVVKYSLSDSALMNVTLEVSRDL